MAFYEISKVVVATGYPHTVPSRLIVPTMKTFATLICDKKQQKKVKLLALSNKTVKYRILEIAD